MSVVVGAVTCGLVAMLLLRRVAVVGRMHADVCRQRNCDDVAVVAANTLLTE